MVIRADENKIERQGAREQAQVCHVVPARENEGQKNQYEQGKQEKIPSVVTAFVRIVPPSARLENDGYAEERRHNERGEQCCREPITCSRRSFQNPKRE